MSNKIYSAVPKTAEEITGIKGCNSFSFFFKDETLDLIYVPEMNELALEKKRIEIEPLEKMADKYYRNYDYKSVMTDPRDGQYFWKKEWLKDFKEEINWSKVPVDTKIIVSKHSDFRNPSKRYFAKYEDGKVYAWESGTTKWSTDGIVINWPYAKLAEEESDEI